jgi:replication factor C subunit 1
LGRNSSKGKKQRIIGELNHHMNYKISGGTQEVRMSYLPFLRQRILTQLKDSQEENSNKDVIQLMDAYGLDRDDVFENFDEFLMDSKAPKFADIDSKRKAAFTREYNAGSHKSQALVEEQGAPKKKRKAGGPSSADPDDPDAIDDDVIEQEESDDGDDDIEKIAAAFKKKGRKSAGGKAKGGAAKGKGRKKK